MFGLDGAGTLILLIVFGLNMYLVIKWRNGN